MLRIYGNESTAPEPTEDRLDDLKPALPDLAEARLDGLHRGGGDSGNIFGILSAADIAEAVHMVVAGSIEGSGLFLAAQVAFSDLNAVILVISHGGANDDLLMLGATLVTILLFFLFGNLIEDIAYNLTAIIANSQRTALLGFTMLAFIFLGLFSAAFASTILIDVLFLIVLHTAGAKIPVMSLVGLQNPNGIQACAAALAMASFIHRMNAQQLGATQITSVSELAAGTLLGDLRTATAGLGVLAGGGNLSILPVMLMLIGSKNIDRQQGDDHDQSQNNCKALLVHSVYFLD